MTVGSMDLQEAYELLSLGVKPGLVENENDASTRELLDVLTYLPLAISQASAYLNENQVSSAEYLQVLHSNNDDMIHLLSEDFEAHGRYNSDYNPVTRTFLISFDQLQRSNTLAADYLQLMSFLNEIDIPYTMLPSAGGKVKMMEAVGGLKAFAFIRQRHDDSFDIHRLVQVSVRRWVTNNGAWGDILKVVINRLNDMLPIPEHETRDTWARYLPHVLSVMNLATEREREDYPNMPQLMSKTGTWLSKMGKYRDAEAMFQEVLVTRTRDLGAKHPETLLTTNNIGAVLFKQGRLEEATSILTQVLAMRKKILGDDHPDVLSSMSNLASTLESTGRFDEAITLREEVLNKRQRTLGNEHPSSLLAMRNLAQLWFRQGKIEEAVAMSTEALEKMIKIIGNDHEEVISAMESHALMLRAQGRVEEAEEMQREAGNRMRRILGHENPDTATATPDISSASVEQSKVEQEVEVKAETI